MASFLDELKNRLKTGNANAELKIITSGGNNSSVSRDIQTSQSSKITTMQIVGCVIGGGIIVLLVVSLILFCNNQREKDENLNLIKSTEKALNSAVEDLKEGLNETASLAEKEMAENLNKASGRLEESKNVDPNFTLLKDLR
jgi:hypothetical protein